VFDAGVALFTPAEPLDNSRPDKLASKFYPTGIATDAYGNLYLAPFCAARIECDAGKTQRDPSSIAFDLHGNSFVLSASQQKAFQSSVVAFEKEGVYLSEPLDSEIYRCQWHSVAIRGELPAGAQIVVDTFTAEAPLDLADIANLSDTAWRTHQNVNAITDHQWDCLVTSPPGRFLYLRLTLRGNGVVTPRINHIKIFFPRISLRRYLPAVFGENPVSADFTDRMLAVFDTIFRSVETRLDYFARYLDPMSAPADRDPRTLADFLSWLASWMGVILDRSWDERKRRLFLRDAYIFHQLRGTLEGLRRQLLLYLSWNRALPAMLVPARNSVAFTSISNPPLAIPWRSAAAISLCSGDASSIALNSQTAQAGSRN
jgi:phage tail-like protein